MSLSLLLSSAVEPLPCLPERVVLAASTDHYSWAQLVSGRKEGWLLQETILAGSRGVSISCAGTARRKRVPALVLLPISMVV